MTWSKCRCLTENETTEVINTFSNLASLISHPRLKQILRIPYFLDMAARMDWSEQQNIPQDIRSFREKCWSDVIRNNAMTVAGLPDRREQALVDLAVRRARELRPLRSNRRNLMLRHLISCIKTASC